MMKVVTTILLTFCMFSASPLLAQFFVASDKQSAGFRFSDSDTPIIEYKQHIYLLAGVDDVPSLQVYADGRVVVHQPVYMKKAGDYEMQIERAELVKLLKEMSSNGIMDFDEKKMKGKIREHKKQLRMKGQFYDVSDATETIVDVRLDEFQKHSKAKVSKNFSKQFRWKNLEQDAKRFKDDVQITKANQSISYLNALMNDSRLKQKKAK